MSEHTIEEDFEHFLAYSGFAKPPLEVEVALFKAYEHGSARTDAQELEQIRNKTIDQCIETVRQNPGSIHFILEALKGLKNV